MSFTASMNMATPPAKPQQTQLSYYDVLFISSEMRRTIAPCHVRKDASDIKPSRYSLQPVSPGRTQDADQGNCQVHLAVSH